MSLCFERQTLSSSPKEKLRMNQRCVGRQSPYFKTWRES